MHHSKLLLRRRDHDHYYHPINIINLIEFNLDIYKLPTINHIQLF